MYRSDLCRTQFVTGSAVVLLVLLLGAKPSGGGDELFVNLIETVVPSPVQPDEPTGPALQDIYVFGELGVPTGQPGSFVLTAADEVVLDAAIAESRISKLNASPAGVSGLR
jgi:hypothetical protein